LVGVLQQPNKVRDPGGRGLPLQVARLALGPPAQDGERPPHMRWQCSFLPLSAGCAIVGAVVHLDCAGQTRDRRPPPERS
jgi:hypothetical protein